MLLANCKLYFYRICFTVGITDSVSIIGKVLQFNRSVNQKNFRHADWKYVQICCSETYPYVNTISKYVSYKSYLEVYCWIRIVRTLNSVWDEKWRQVDRQLWPHSYVFTAYQVQCLRMCWQTSLLSEGPLWRYAATNCVPFHFCTRT